MWKIRKRGSLVYMGLISRGICEDECVEDERFRE